ncbi:hypothetical protein DS745_21980 [Anaerobacillus alkaliphilus]|uniref:Uncharacterized protein n=1 Tax=Anaerobacillus alkaliphilus TaxID=1548597 RepID=A0A4Q0VN40_9BACI|nr:hypothetical protein [Anaerobacillus alkaliphilus]RXI96386.1 hypothetical protein DS745_21980 [Anaerobacillus alkaliphilus]
MKHYDDQDDLDQNFKQLNKIAFKKSQKEEVYVTMMEKITRSRKKKRFHFMIKNVIATSFVALFVLVGGYILINEVIIDNKSNQGTINEVKSLLNVLEIDRAKISSISITNLNENTWTEVKDESMIDMMISDLAKLEVIEDEVQFSETYRVELSVENHPGFTIEFAEGNYMRIFDGVVANHYKIMNDNNYLRTIESDLLVWNFEGVFRDYADGDQLIISYNGMIEYFSITSEVLEDLATIAQGDTITFSFIKSQEGRLLLQTVSKR